MNWFQAISSAGAFFVTRIKNNAQIEFLGLHREPNKKLGVLRDEIIWYTGFQSVKKYPGELRLIEFRDEEKRKNLSVYYQQFPHCSIFDCRNLQTTMANRLFFKWIKHNLKIKSFLGTSENAVMSQIWVAMIHYLLIAYLKFLHGFKLGMTELTNRIRDTLMQNQSLLEVLSLDRKILEKPPNWNLPVQEELFSPLLL